MTEIETLKKRYFPRVPWSESAGPVRRAYLVRTADGGEAGAALADLAEAEGFTEPGQRTVTGGAEECLAAFREKAAGGAVGMIFGSSAGVHWCDIALDAPDGEGWQRMLVRSEEGENLTALSHSLGLLRFRKAE